MDTNQRLRAAAEKLALTLAQGGMQRATARVMTALLYTGKESMTAADLREELSISSGAVSTAIKQLAPLGLVERVPAPGSRRDHYRLRQGAWSNLMSQQNALLTVMCDAAREGIDAAGADGVTGRRLHEMQDFYTYMLEELVPLIDRWREQYTAGTGGASAG
ncbi:DNA-binding transcriptional regulator GbsR, MarR family [Sinosporangium album]|uniref:DNA-binding transcriptional regulator GbsR, MarR family n=1 Tax=Sinosporangium album TaxID=504805 RepID=A0A1G8DH74_9ACTN|nr:MarR family transcriptional regulator [Sinosporangium album]SDH56984.1 DNA-binding transcriptional regulator GbsR, MarR family [Sinosporangium album]